MSRVGSNAGASRQSRLPTARQCVNYHLPPSATDYNTYNDLDQPHPIIALFFIVKSQESKVPNLILFSFGMSRRVERI